MQVRVATRASRLAMAQTEWVVRLLRSHVPEARFEVVPVTTQGDEASRRWEARHLEDAPGSPGTAGPGTTTDRDQSVGAFVKELERALLDGRADIAVHSLKDVPTELPAGLVLGAFPDRDDPRDALVLPRGAPGARGAPAGGGEDASAVARLRALGEGARLGTSSMRRWVQAAMLRPGLRAVEVRGNVETRMARLDEGRADALVLAGAGMRRLGLEARIDGWFELEEMVPAVGQGMLAIECRRDDAGVLETVRAADHPSLRAAAAAERAFLARLGAGCRWPAGAAGWMEGSTLRLRGFAALPVESGRWMAVRGHSGTDLDQEAERWEGAAREAGEALAESLLAHARAGDGTVVEGLAGV